MGGKFGRLDHPRVWESWGWIALPSEGVSDKTVCLVDFLKRKLPSLEQAGDRVYASGLTLSTPFAQRNLWRLVRVSRIWRRGFLLF